ncbi:MAG: polysaccharide biosynthesis C-terminal domain-containing protein, partial [Chloroflexota bacterium]
FTLTRLYPGVFHPINWTKKLFRDLNVFSFPATVASILMLLLQWVTRLILGYLRPEAEVGIYQAAYQIATLPAIILIAISTVFLPIIAQLAHDRQFEELNELYKITTKWSLYLSLPVILVICFFPREWLTLLFGANYSEGDKVLVLIVLSQLINAGTGAVAFMYLMLDKQRSLIWIHVASLLLIVLLNFWLIPLWGVMGAAIGSALGISIANLVQVYYLRIQLNLWPYDRRYWKGIVSAFFSALAIWLIAFLPLEKIYLLIFSTFLSIAVFIFALWKMQLDPEDKIFVDGIRRRLGI